MHVEYAASPLFARTRAIRRRSSRTLARCCYAWSSRGSPERGLGSLSSRIARFHATYLFFCAAKNSRTAAPEFNFKTCSASSVALSSRNFWIALATCT
jgi:hypothetical protein